MLGEPGERINSVAIGKEVDDVLGGLILGPPPINTDETLELLGVIIDDRIECIKLVIE